MVQNLNNNLITAPELAELRKRLRNLETKEGQVFFVALFRSWCHNAVATFSLCLLAQAYEQAYNLLQIFAELEMTVNMLIQIDKLVQLLESPVFTCELKPPSFPIVLCITNFYLPDLRLQLLEPERFPHLYKCLYGVLMLLPQSSAFAALKNRLNSVSAIGYLHIAPRTSYVSHVRQKSTETKFSSGPPSTTSSTTFDRPNRLKAKDEPGIKWNELLEKFKSVQEKAKRANQVHGPGEDKSFPTAAPESGAGEMGSQKALPEVPKQLQAGRRPTSADGVSRPGPSPAPPPSVSVQKPKSSLGHLGRFAGNVAGRKGKK